MDEIERKRAEDLGFEFEEGKEPGEPFWPDHVLKQVISVYIALAVVLALATLSPWGLHEKANPIETPHAIKPEWYFLSSYQLLKYMPKKLGMLITTVGFGLLVLWPFLDRRPVKSARKRPVSVLIGLGGVTMMVLLTVLGHISENTYKIGESWVHFDAKAFPHTLERDENGIHYYISENIVIPIKIEEEAHEVSHED